MANLKNLITFLRFIQLHMPTCTVHLFLAGLATVIRLSRAACVAATYKATSSGGLLFSLETLSGSLSEASLTSPSPAPALRVLASATSVN